MTAKEHWQEGALLWRLGWARLRARLWLTLGVVAVGAVGVLLQHGWDDALLGKIRFADDDRLNFVAGKLGFWGDWVWNVAVAVTVWLAGVIFQRARWRRLGWVCLWAFLVASVAVNLFRSPLGRARPSAGVPDGFYGPRFKSDYQGFPSGHTTSSFATATAVLAATPVLGVPCTVYAAAVGWSRMQLNRHRPLDVVTGAALGALVGWAFGGALREERRRSSG